MKVSIATLELKDPTWNRELINTIKKLDILWSKHMTESDQQSISSHTKLSVLKMKTMRMEKGK